MDFQTRDCGPDRQDPQGRGAKGQDPQGRAGREKGSGDTAALPAQPGRTAALLLALVAGALAWRLSLHGDLGFPAGDGALFARFVEAFAAAPLSMPERIAFNGHDLPFAYPPLSFWLGGLLSRLGLDPVTVGVVYPLAVLAAYTAVCLVLLRRALGRDDLFLIAAAFVLFNAEGFAWLAMGGGLSRATGALFFALALLAARPPGLGGPSSAARAPTLAPTLARPVLAGTLVALAILSHLEWGIDAALAVTLVALAGAWSERALAPLLRLCLAGAVALALVLPWLAWILTTHGLEPFANASATSGWNGALLNLALILTLRFLHEPTWMLGLLGLLVCLGRRRAFWPVLLIALLVATPRHFPSVAALPQAVLVALGAGALLDLLAGRGPVASRLMAWSGRGWQLAPRPRHALAGLAAAVLAGHLIVSAGRDGDLQRALRQAPSQVLSLAARAPEHLPPEARIVVLEGRPWAVSFAAEWFAHLADRQVITLAQGTEWLPDALFAHRAGLTWHLATRETCADLREAIDRHAGGATHVLALVRRDCFVGAPGYRVADRQGDVALLHRIGRQDSRNATPQAP